MRSFVWALVCEEGRWVGGERITDLALRSGGEEGGGGKSSQIGLNDLVVSLDVLRGRRNEVSHIVLLLLLPFVCVRLLFGLLCVVWVWVG